MGDDERSAASRTFSFRLNEADGATFSTLVEQAGSVRAVVESLLHAPAVATEAARRAGRKEGVAAGRRAGYAAGEREGRKHSLGDRERAVLETRIGRLQADVSVLRAQADLAEAGKALAERHLQDLLARDSHDAEYLNRSLVCFLDGMKAQVIPQYDHLTQAVLGLRPALEAGSAVVRDLAADAQRRQDEAEARAAVAAGYVQGRQDERAGRPLPPAVAAYLTEHEPAHPLLARDRGRPAWPLRGSVAPRLRPHPTPRA